MRAKKSFSMKITTRSYSDDDVKVLQEQGLSPLVARVYAARGISSKTQLTPALKDLLPPNLLGMDELGKLVAKAIVNGDRIRIVGDFDADGITATALAVDVFRTFGGNVDYVIPSRLTEDHGTTPEIVRQAHKDGVKLIMTVDNGISSVEAAQVARELGIVFCVTDHHLPSEIMPKAACCVNPNQAGCPFPSKALAGVGVAFYVAAAVREKMKESANGHQDIHMAGFLDIVALGTLADNSMLDLNNRILVNHGIQSMVQGKCRKSITVMFESAGRNPAYAQAYDVTHYLAPMINAAGRFGQSEIAVEFLLAKDVKEMQKLANSLRQLNEKRKSLQEKIMRTIESQPDFASQPGIVLYDPDWHVGILGIIASQVANRNKKPCIVLSTQSAGILRGSGRSGGVFDIHTALQALGTENPNLLLRHGGHQHAIGLALKEENLNRFTRLFMDQVERQQTASETQNSIEIDGRPSATEITADAAIWLNKPVWGRGFGKPLFLGEFRKQEEWQRGNCRRLKIDMDGHLFRGITYSSSPLDGRFKALFRIVPSSMDSGMPLLILDQPVS